MVALSWRDFGISLGINSGVAVVTFFAFNYIRASSLFLKFYAAKRYLKLPFR